MKIEFGKSPAASNGYAGERLLSKKIPLSKLGFQGLFGMASLISILLENPVSGDSAVIEVSGPEAGALLGGLSHAHALHLQSFGLTL